MLRDVLDEIATVLRTEIGASLASDGIDVEIEPRMVLSPSEGICLDVYRGESARDGASAGMGDISGVYALTVRARATTADGDEAQDILTDMSDDLNEICVAAALESAEYEWATFVAVDPDGFSGLLDFSTAASPMVGCTWRVLTGVAVS